MLTNVPKKKTLLNSDNNNTAYDKICVKQISLI